MQKRLPTKSLEVLELRFHTRLFLVDDHHNDVLVALECVWHVIIEVRNLRPPLAGNEDWKCLERGLAQEQVKCRGLAMQFDVNALGSDG
jgi:hypothetical protein